MNEDISTEIMNIINSSTNIIKLSIEGLKGSALDNDNFENAITHLQSAVNASINILKDEITIEDLQFALKNLNGILIHIPGNSDIENAIKDLQFALNILIRFLIHILENGGLKNNGLKNDDLSFAIGNLQSVSNELDKIEKELAKIRGG